MPSRGACRGAFACTLGDDRLHHRIHRRAPRGRTAPLAAALVATVVTCACTAERGPSLTAAAPRLDAALGQPEGAAESATSRPWAEPDRSWDGTSPLTADAAVRCALVNNRALRRTLAEADRRRAAYGDAQLAPNPTLSAAVGAPLSMGVVPVLATLAAQVDWLWKRDAIVGDADAQLRSILLESAAMAAASVVEARAAYVETASTAEQAALAARDAEVAARVLRAEELAFAAGDSTADAANRARMNAAEATSRVMEAQVAVITAKTRLLEAIGRGDHHLDWTLADGSTASAIAACSIGPAPAPEDDDALRALVRSRRFDVRAAEARVAGAESRAALAAAGRIPTLFLGAGYERDMESDDAAMVMIESQLPIFNDGRFRVDAAMADAEIARIDADRVWQRAVIDARRALADIAAAEHHAATLRERTLGAFAANRRLLEQSVEAGERRALDLWRSEHQENHLLLQLARAERDRALATLAFDRALAGGRLPSMQQGGMGTAAGMGGAPSMPDFGFTALETME